MFTPAQINTMLSLQCEMNSTVNPNWLEANYPFLRAVVVEGGEALEHHGWKWWKAQSMDRAQVALELVDILHFYLSHQILATYKLPGGQDCQRSDLLDRAASSIASDLAWQGGPIGFDGRQFDPESMALLDQFELMVGLSTSRRASFRLLAAAATNLGLSPADMFSQYVGKNVLNIFRQQNGYKEGTYEKTWADGREDNEHLADIMARIPTEDADYIDQVRTALAASYPGSTSATALG